MSPLSELLGPLILCSYSAVAMWHLGLLLHGVLAFTIYPCVTFFAKYPGFILLAAIQFMCFRPILASRTHLKESSTFPFSCGPYTSTLPRWWWLKDSAWYQEVIF